MAWKDVELTEEEQQGSGARKFYKFAAIGDKMAGRFVKTQPSTGTYAKPGQLDYVFRVKSAETGAIEEVLVTPPFDAALRLEKATKANMMPVGAAVLLTFVSTRNVGKEHDQKIFSLKVDPTPGPSAPKPPPPKVSGDDDMPF